VRAIDLDERLMLDLTEASWPDPVSRSTTSERVVDVVSVNVAA